MSNRFEDWVPCPDCTKKGGVPRVSCNRCGGSGWVKGDPVDHTQDTEYVGGE